MKPDTDLIADIGDMSASFALAACGDGEAAAYC